MRQFLIVHFVHRLLNAVLRAIQFLPDAGPVSLISGFRDGLCMWRDRVTDANPLRQPQHPLTNVLNRRSILSLDSNESIRDHRAEKERDAWAFRKIIAFAAPDVLLPVYAA